MPLGYGHARAFTEPAFCTSWTSTEKECVFVSCFRARPDDARRLQQADLAMWTAVTRRDWTACLEHGAEMIAAFGTATSPPLMVMSQCATASGMPDAGLTAALARALMAEMVAHPGPQPDFREQLLLALRQLDAMHAAGGEDYATDLRADMATWALSPKPIADYSEFSLAGWMDAATDAPLRDDGGRGTRAPVICPGRSDWADDGIVVRRMGVAAPRLLD